MAKKIFKILVKNTMEWIIIAISGVFIFGVSAYGLAYLPIVDFYPTK